MAEEPIIIPAQIEIPLVPAADHAAQPAPTGEQERVADDVFSREQNEAAAALLAAQMGLGILHNLAAETFQRSEERKPLPRKPRPEDEGDR